MPQCVTVINKGAPLSSAAQTSTVVLAWTHSLMLVLQLIRVTVRGRLGQTKGKAERLFLILLERLKSFLH